MESKNWLPIHYIKERESGERQTAVLTLNMTIFLKLLCILCLSFLVPSCSVFDGDGGKLVDDYKVSWIDDRQQTALYKGEQLIPPSVFAVGYDSKFIFAKRHEVVLINGQQVIDESVIYYYIIERTKREFQDKPLYGPLSEDAFIMKCVELGIEQPKFDLSY